MELLVSYIKFIRNYLELCAKLLALASELQSLRSKLEPFYQYLIFWVWPFWVELCYFISLSLWGFLVLKALPANQVSKAPTSGDLDLFFTSVSTATVSSMTSVEMEAFSDSQLLVLTILMLAGGEVFTSLLGLLLRQSKLHRKISGANAVEPGSSSGAEEIADQTLSGLRAIQNVENGTESSMADTKYLKNRALGYLKFVVLGYHLVVHVTVSSLILLYLGTVHSARGVLKGKGIKMVTFAIFTVVSSFANCGFIPTNENMEVFKKDSGLLLLIIPLILAGNTLYPSFLRLVIWVLWRITKRGEFEYMLKRQKEMGYDHLLPARHCYCLVGTVVAFVMLQFILFSSMEWNSDGLSGMNPYQKVVGVIFMSVNSRHSGESIVDLSVVSPAILVLYVFMMYLPPYTYFDPIEGDGATSGSVKDGKKRSGLWMNLTFSQLSYLVMFIILICISERKMMLDDPLNFNVLNVVVEVISAYGNVGFSTGYSCQRQLKPKAECKDASIGFSGRWSREGKLILIVVMIFGRLKKFNMQGGKAWKLS